jgi:SAM-dependent methyltransferase
MRLLDVGCGPGSITRGLAERLAPGEVVGLDLSRETLAAARQDAATRGLETWVRNGGEPRMGRRLRALFNAAGVRDLRITAVVWCYATPDETVEWGESYAQRLLTSPMGERPVEYGYATRADIEAMAAAFRAWSVHPDAFWAFLHAEALARKAG